MGNSHPTLHQEAKAYIGRFDADEMAILEKLWTEMADHNDGKGIGKTQFLEWIQLPGLFGERMFKCFVAHRDKSSSSSNDEDASSDNESIDYDAFITGLGIACRGSFDEKCHFLFEMLDANNHQFITREEFSTFVNHIPKKDIHKNDAVLTQRRLSIQLSSVQGDSALRAGACSNPSSPGREGGAKERTESFDSIGNSVDSYTNHDVTHDAFVVCSSNSTNINYEEFKMWLELNPGMLEYIESFLPLSQTKGAESVSSSTDSGDAIAVSKSQFQFPQRATPEIVGLSLSSKKGWVGNSFFGNIERSYSVAEDLQLQVDASERDSKAMALLVEAFHTAESEYLRSHIVGVLEAFKTKHSIVKEILTHSANDVKYDSLQLSLPSVEIDHSGNDGSLSPSTKSGNSNTIEDKKEGFLWKSGNVLHFMKKRYYKLKKNCLYYFSDEKDQSPKGVIFLAGSIISIHKDASQEGGGYFGFEISHQDLLAGAEHKHENRLLFCKSIGDRERWIHALQHAAHVVPIEEEYRLDKEIDTGRFSVVYKATHKQTGIIRAVKRINKTTIAAEEKELLRTEIVVLKLMNHPNIIKLEGLHECKDYLDIAMEYVSGGNLLNNIQNRPRFKENEAARVIRPLLEAIAYIHDLGIVHRDIKPENIICAEGNIEDLKIADFGLSRMILPGEKLDLPCGTLSYVAPEVLSQQGYGKEVDIWAVGVIAFILLCGKLPFEGSKVEDILRSFNEPIEHKISPRVLAEFSEDAKSFIKVLLSKEPSERATARSALKHPFFAKASSTYKEN